MSIASAKLKSAFAVFTGYFFVEITLGLVFGLLFPPLLVLTYLRVILSIGWLMYLLYKRMNYMSRVTDNYYDYDRIAVDYIPMPTVLHFFHGINFIIGSILIAPFWLVYKAVKVIYNAVLNIVRPPPPHPKELLIKNISKAKFRNITYLTEKDIKRYREIIGALENEVERRDKLDALDKELKEVDPISLMPRIYSEKPITFTFKHKDRNNIPNRTTYAQDNILNWLNRESDNRESGRNPLMTDFFLYDEHHTWEVGVPAQVAVFIDEVKATIARASKHKKTKIESVRMSHEPSSNPITQQPAAASRPFFNNPQDNRDSKNAANEVGTAEEKTPLLLSAPQYII